MLKWSIIFAIVALIAGALGYSGVAAGAETIAWILFGIAVVLFILAVVVGKGLFNRIK